MIEDQQEFEVTLKPYRDLGYIVLTISAQEKTGINTLRDCLHLHEPDYAVRAAVRVGGVSQLRYENYTKIIGSRRN